jgi:hypothetical protein
VSKKPIYDEYDPWATYNPGAPDVVRRNPNQQRKPETPGALLHDCPATAAMLGVTEEKVRTFVRSGELRYINVGQGTKRPRYRFADSDIKELIERRTQQDIPQCQFSRPQSPRRISGTTSKSTVVGFTALRAAQTAKTPKNSRR